MTEDQKVDILKKLEEDEYYYGDFGKQFMSNSDIYALLNDPLSFHKKLENNINLLKGGYFHTMILEPEKLCNYASIDASTRNTKIYKDAVKENDGQMILLNKEVAELNALGVKLMECDAARSLIKDIDVEYEVPGLVELEGKWWKCKGDIINNTQQLIVDIKTTSNIDSFEKSAMLYNYDSQAYIYSSYFGMDMIFLVIDKLTGKIGIFDCSPDFIERGKEKVIAALEQYELFFEDEDFDPKQYIITKTL